VIYFNKGHTHQISGEVEEGGILMSLGSTTKLFKYRFITFHLYLSIFEYFVKN